ncbi:MAG: sigma-70 family RNA polymerase sigma factor [Clostridiales bacterium]|nr:sigma-70 family RNA polymerase sigma factor [Clostridiales bacterium]
MDEQNLLSRLRHGDEQALAAAITQYSAYVVTVIHNRSRGLLSPEDEDELASSVFFTLWQSCRTVKSGHLRAWLGSVARNKTVDRLRKSRSEIPLDEDLAGTEGFLLEEASKREQAQQLRAAVAQLSETDREIIFRFYDLCQPAVEIAAALGLTPAAVRMRLVRSREAIRNELCRGGFVYESD